MSGRRAGPAMEFQSDRLRMLGSRLTETIISAALARVVEKEKIPDCFSDGDRRLALIVVREMNPDQSFDEKEEACLRGMSHTTLRSMKVAKELPACMQSPGFA